MFGPTIFACLRIRPQASTAEWIIERQMTKYDEEGNYVDSEWKEYARIPGQLDEDFCEFK